ncbi:triacylglycerol lipase 2-like [Carex rostrata]
MACLLAPSNNMVSVHNLVLTMISTTLFFIVTTTSLVTAHGRIRRLSSSQNSNNIIEVSSVERSGLCASLVTPLGYKCEEHQVTTQDGYILSLQRIPEGRHGGNSGEKKQPVFLQHGVLMDGITWLLNPPDQSLAFILADRGFDVWIANSRGTRWSSRHVTLTTNQPVYWAWSWDELVTQDLPATFDYVYRLTGQNLHYVGHSMGTLVALASFSEGRLVDKIKSVALLSPVAYLAHMSTPIGIICAKAFVGEVVTEWFRVAQFNPKAEIVTNFLKAFCHEPLNCYDLMQSYTGENCCLNASTIEVFLKYEPQPTSTRTLVHLAQTFRDGVLAKYNFTSEEENMKRYGHATPPVYQLSNIPRSLPLFVSYGGQDSLADSADVTRLLDDLKLHDRNKLTVHFVKDYAHADFVMGVSAKQLVYESVIAFFDRN